ncbi:MAG: DUF2497 domain-containing protein [Ancalomicrobiaceae bacterium]|nr:DUF2497 domain-containing protein [Ancalomicrobiaceae bacterium]
MAKAQAQEPSMEEILASIRRIIADEDTAPPVKPAAVPAPVPTAPSMTVSEDELDKLFDNAAGGEPEEEDILDLAETDKADEPDLMLAQDDIDDLDFEPIAKPAPEPEVRPEVKPAPAAYVAPEPLPSPPPRRRPDPEPEPDFEPVADYSTARRDPLLSESTDSMVSAAFDNLAMTLLNKNARTVEDLIQDMLRPMLKAWLDQNLPAIVERLVRAEIERVARGR